MAVFIVADAGINHQGNIDIAIELIDLARWAGFDAVKFQKRNPERYPETPYLSPILGETTYREHKRALELSEADYQHIINFCYDAKFQWFASCFDKESVDFIARAHPKYWKIPSPCILDLDLVRYFAQQNGFIIMSTGMSTIEEMNAAIAALVHYKTYDEIALLHCCSEYPTPPEHINLRVIEWLKRTYPCKIGYSSHDAGVPASVAAVGMGAEIIEVHITLDRTMPGSDHSASLEREEMERLVRHIRAVDTALGTDVKQFYEGERKIRKKVQQISENSD